MTDPNLTARLASLPSLPMAQLWRLWDEHFPRRPQRVNRAFLEARLAYRLQEAALGGLPAAVRRYLADHGERCSKIKSGRGPQLRLMPGSVIVREWDDRQYRVEVGADGHYLLDGRSYRSLSAVARAITGTHWSGPAFFGLKGVRR